ncbi:MAG: hypothetical protein AB1505_35620 [Candidatus Latescibacterota bacterium]
MQHLDSVSLLPIVVLIRLSALYYAQAYHFVWRYAGIGDLVKLLEAVVAGLLLLAVVNYFRDYPVGVALATAFFVSALFHRGVLHFLPRMQHKRLLVGAALDFQNDLAMPRGVLVFGAGDVGRRGRGAAAERDAAALLRLEDAEDVLIQNAQAFNDAIAEVAGSAAELRRRHGLTPSHWWWYLDKLAPRLTVRA